MNIRGWASAAASLIPDLATAMNLKSDQRGALVNQVSTGSPAEQAGLRASDEADDHQRAECERGR